MREYKCIILFKILSLCTVLKKIRWKSVKSWEYKTKKDNNKASMKSDDMEMYRNESK